MILNDRFYVKWWLYVAVFLFSAQALLTACAGAEVREATLTQSEEAVNLNSSFALQLSLSLTDAVNHGIPLVFQIQAQVRRPRWYWVDEALYAAHTDRRLTYNALVRNYRVTEGQEDRNFMNLSDALNYVARPVGWPIAGGRIRSGEMVDVQVRFRLDQAFLPKPFQVVSLGIEIGGWMVIGAVFV
ncbi:MAG: hypothetical protein EoVTN8_300 [Fluviibacter phosphoraccumulans EoVTN8]